MLILAGETSWQHIVIIQLTCMVVMQFRNYMIMSTLHDDEFINAMSKNSSFKDTDQVWLNNPRNNKQKCGCAMLIKQKPSAAFQLHAPHIVTGFIAYMERYITRKRGISDIHRGETSIGIDVSTVMEKFLRLVAHQRNSPSSVCVTAPIIYIHRYMIQTKQRTNFLCSQDL